MTTTDDWTFITLEIAGLGVDPLALTRELGITPTSTSDTSTRPPGWGYWNLDTRSHVHGDWLADHLRWLGDRFRGALPALHSRAAAGSARLLAHGAPHTWVLDTAGEWERQRLGLPLSFAVFVKADPEIKVVRAVFADPDGTA